MFLELHSPGKPPRALTLDEAVHALGPDAPEKLRNMGFDEETAQKAREILADE